MKRRPSLKAVLDRMGWTVKIRRTEACVVGEPTIGWTITVRDVVLKEHRLMIFARPFEECVERLHETLRAAVWEGPK